MERRLNAMVPIAQVTDAASFGEIAALIGEIYLVLLALLVVGAAIIQAVNAPMAFIQIDDAAIASNFSA
jgi:hypothetical protein